MKSVRFHPKAREELRAAAMFYERESQNLGKELVREVKAVLVQVREWPESGSPDVDEVRRVVLARFPFALIYRFVGEVVEVIAVMHQRRKPGYWRDR